MQCNVERCFEEKDLVKVLVDIDPTYVTSMGHTRFEVYVCHEHRLQLEQGTLKNSSMVCLKIPEGNVKKGGVADPPSGPKPDVCPVAQKIDPAIGDYSVPINHAAIEAEFAYREVGKALIDASLCLCLKCHAMGTVGQFTVPIGGGDHEGRCPNCHAGEKDILSVDDDQDEFLRIIKEELS